MIYKSNYTCIPHNFQTAPEPPPYSSAWYEQLEAVNPIQAMLAALIVSRTGRTNVCCICGDEYPHDPVCDYQWNGRGLIVRLCADCKALQEIMYAAPGKALIRVKGCTR